MSARRCGATTPYARLVLSWVAKHIGEGMELGTYLIDGYQVSGDPQGGAHVTMIAHPGGKHKHCCLDLTAADVHFVAEDPTRLAPSIAELHAILYRDAPPGALPIRGEA